MFRAVGHEAVTDLYTDAYFEAYTGGDYIADAAARRYESEVRLRWMGECGAAPSGSLLEVGAAAGYFVAAATAAGWQARGIEPAPNLAAHAREVTGADVEAGFLEQAELEPGSLSAVVMWHVLEHIPDPHSALQRIAPSLRPEGHLFIEVPNAGSIVAERRGWSWWPLELDVHVSHFTPQAMSALAERSGYRVQRIDTIPFHCYAEHVPRRLALRAVLAARQRGLVATPHPTGHELLRVCLTPAS